MLICQHIVDTNIEKDGYIPRIVPLQHLMEFLGKWKQKLGNVIEFLYEDVREAIQMKNNVNDKQPLVSCKHMIKYHSYFLYKNIIQCFPNNSLIVHTIIL